MRRILIAWVLVSAVVGTAAAHDTWMTGRAVRESAGTRIELELTSGMAFPSPESAVAADRIARAEVLLGDARSRLRAEPGGTASLTLRSEPLRDGLALASVVLEPRTLTLDPAQVAEYLDELEASPEVRAAYAKSGRWRERYRKNATALVRVGEGGGPVAPIAPLGLPLELVALSDPSKLPSGAGIRACLYAKGKPVTDHRVGLVSANEPGTPWLRTGPDGCVDFELTLPGRYLLRAIVLKPARRPGLDWISEFATLTFELPH